MVRGKMTLGERLSVPIKFYVMFSYYINAALRLSSITTANDMVHL
jgi:hypothetical protein